MKKTWFICLYTITFLMMLPITSNADIGPKPSLTIIVKGMGEEEYWLDLLVSDETEYMWLDISEEELERVSKLANYNEDGLHPALLVGTHFPMYGSLKGERQEDGSYIHRFTYVGVPSEFKIAILKNDGTMIISDMVKRNHFQSVMEYTLGTSRISERVDLNAVKEIFPRGYIWGLLQRMAATLIIEIIIALLFGFTLKKSWKTLLITNIVTQTMLNIFIIFATYRGGQLLEIFVFFIGELFVLATEIIVYSRSLVEHGMKRRIVYTVLANAASLAAGFWMLFLP